MLNRSIKALNPDLVKVYEVAVPRYDKKFPLGPRMSLNETSRNELVQNAYYLQGRVNLAPLNEARAKAGLPAIGLEEARHIVSNAKYGQSAHNFPLARGFDMKAENRGLYIGDRGPYYRFWIVFKEVADEMGVPVVWGGTWKDWPHIELRDWRTM